MYSTPKNNLNECKHQVHSVLTACAQVVHIMFTSCLNVDRYLHKVLTPCAHHVHTMFTSCSHHALTWTAIYNKVWTPCAHRVNIMLTWCEHHVSVDRAKQGNTAIIYIQVWKCTCIPSLLYLQFISKTVHLKYNKMYLLSAHRQWTIVAVCLWFHFEWAQTIDRELIGLHCTEMTCEVAGFVGLL